MPETVYMTKADVIEAYNISVRTLQRWMKSGLEFTRLPSMVVFKKEDVEAFANEKGYGGLAIVMKKRKRQD